MSWHLAQLNIGRIRAPLTDPLMGRFFAQLDEINALADATPGFVWRLKEHELPEPDPTSQAYAAESIIVNLSVWESVESLQRYVYHSAHAGVLRDRREWFEKMEERWMALWWVPAGHRPPVAEGKERLEHLRAHGNTAHAFNFKQPFPPPGASFRADFS